MQQRAIKKIKIAQQRAIKKIEIAQFSINAKIIHFCKTTRLCEAKIAQLICKKKVAQ
jgi:hypothetical protein